MRANVVRVAGGSIVALGFGVMLTACGTGQDAAGSGSTTGQVSASATSQAATPATLVDTGSTHPTGNNASTPVYVDLYDANNTLAQKPKELDFYENTDMVDIFWSSWGSETAQGNGTLTDNDCTPNCASGHHDTYTAHIVLSDIQTVHGKREYTRYTVTFAGQAQHPELAAALTNQQIKQS